MYCTSPCVSLCFLFQICMYRHTLICSSKLWSKVVRLEKLFLLLLYIVFF
uniref:Uncharacterized protein n=1 Tax=Octopus bimaculoides TaxID=37653 RepID=A0A0L8FYZ0_OCTBM